MVHPPVRAGQPTTIVERADWTAANPGSLHTLAGFLHVLELDASDSLQQRRAIDELRRGELQAVLVHGIVSPREATTIVQQLERHDPPFVQSAFPGPFKASFYGRNVNLADPALIGYFEQARIFNTQLSSLVGGGLPLPQRLDEILASLDGGRRFVAAPGPRADETYMFTTIRAHRPGGYIPAHYDNEMLLRPSYHHLSGQVEPHIISFVLTFDPAEGGGALEVFDSRCATGDARLLSDDHVRDKPDLATLASVRFRLPAGSMIVLDSGRYLHRVTPVEGARIRWTACSFMALARDGCTMQCWG